MAPLSHVFVSTEVAGRKTPLLVFGSILPDIAWGSKTQFSKQKIHYAPREFYSFIQNNYPEMIDLGIAVRLHTQIDRGADFYSDDRHEGFAYKEAPRLTNDVADLLELTTKGIDIPWKFGLKINSNSWIGKWKKANATIALVLAHNFVEFGVDLNLIDGKPSLLKLYQESLDLIDREKIYILLAEYLAVSRETVATEVMRFLEIINYSQTSIQSIAEKTVAPLLTTLFGRTIESEKITSILSKAKGITKKTYTPWLTSAVQQMKIDFDEMLPTSPAASAPSATG